jgi:hypothetical protein
MGKITSNWIRTKSNAATRLAMLKHRNARITLVLIRSQTMNMAEMAAEMKHAQTARKHAMADASI